MQNNKKNSGMTKFESAVRNTPDIAAGYKRVFKLLAQIHHACRWMIQENWREV